MDKAESAKKILLDKAQELGRVPLKADLDEKELCFVKGVLGPFPRALEKAGLKAVIKNPKRNKRRN